jgi:hypothetical protein
MRSILQFLNFSLGGIILWKCGRKVLEIPTASKKCKRCQSSGISLDFFKEIHSFDISLDLNCVWLRGINNDPSSPNIAAVLKINNKTFFPVDHFSSLGPFRGISGSA